MITLFWTSSLLFMSSLAAPIQKVHSHNDYLQAVPLFTALDTGVISVEADLWLENGNLFVAHTEGEIDTSKTFDSLYVQPLVKVIDEQTYGDLFTKDNPLQLLIDFKSDGDDSFDPIVAALGSLRSKGYLTTVKDGVYTQSFVTAVGTGNTPLDKVLASNPRDLFFDADITSIASNPPAAGLTWSKEIAPLASADFQDAVGFFNWLAAQIGVVTNDTNTQLKKHIANAHQFDGVKSRFYGTPNQDSVNIAIIKDGSDWINADNLQHAKDLIAQNGSG
ncbi:hypothetical protein K435DRAFT_803704 [Dendrothele bispora CBS 962.96]|uniref:Altered inheritance of mitochondria protein 6 n=1 Tax=Dendrothele bispora (strain CBS 962.96) TaxID=1314807 RepID=A0A4S8LHY2_DENBC|nr:hypothetical protein K435DRAFT_803704 [Dendrothele bispora CBS 962.96]